ncbi:MAG: hypothetical protein IMX00_10865 [Limnochordales bacterium]|nr:hypothetical protein [Limnochordales bacterium]
MTGVILSLPILVTLYTLWMGFLDLDDLVDKAVRDIAGGTIPGLGTVTLCVLVFLTGLFGTRFLGRLAVNWFDQLTVKIPIDSRVTRAGWVAWGQ